MRGKEFVRKGVSYIGSRKRRWKIYREQRGSGFLIGLLASAAAPFQGKIAKPIFKKFSVVEGDNETKLYFDDELSNWTLPCQTFAARYERISRKNLPGNIRVTRTRTIGPRKKRTRKKKLRLALANKPTQDRARR